MEYAELSFNELRDKYLVLRKSYYKHENINPPEARLIVDEINDIFREMKRREEHIGILHN